MRKLIATLALISMTSVYAVAPVQMTNKLNDAYNELNYSLATGDQNDQAFYDATVEQFQGVIEKAAAEGMTQAELLEFAQSKSAQDIKPILDQIDSETMTNQEIQDFVVSEMTKNNVSGAHWIGGLSTLQVGAIVVGIAAVVGVIAYANRDKGPHTPDCFRLGANAQPGVNCTQF